MSQETPAPTSPRENDVPTSHQMEQPPSSSTADTATGSKSPRSGSEDCAHTGAEPTKRTDSEISQQSTGTPNGEIEDVDQPDVEAHSKEHVGNSQEPLDDFVWEELEHRFAARMEECRKNEQALGQEFSEWLKVNLPQILARTILIIFCLLYVNGPDLQGFHVPERMLQPC